MQYFTLFKTNPDEDLPIPPCRSAGLRQVSNIGTKVLAEIRSASQAKHPSEKGCRSGGEGGIRTREPLWVTRFPSVRAKPDYATSPCQAGELYHVKLTIKMVRLTTSGLINYWVLLPVF